MTSTLPGRPAFCGFCILSRRGVKGTILNVLIALLILCLAGLQFLHMSLITQLDSIDAHQIRDYQLDQQVYKMYWNMLKAINTSQVMDARGEYLIVNNLIQANTSPVLSNNETVYEVTLVTQCSANHLYRIQDLVAMWRGPISVGVFATEKHLPVVFDIILKLFLCHSNIFENVSIHLVVPLMSSRHHILPKLIQKDVCKGLRASFERQSTISENYAWTTVQYPSNLLRNVAMDNARTSHIFVIDIDMLPNAGLGEEFRRSFKNISSGYEDHEQIVYVVPSFEIKASSTVIPNDKRLLVRMWYRKIIRPFYQELCWKCQRYTNYTAWRNMSMSSELDVAYEADWKDPWEPFFIAPRTVPRFDERFKQYGFNRISQSCELHIAGYRFLVLNNAFLIHRGFKTSDKFHATKNEEQNRNRILFRRFKEGLKLKYPNSTERC